MGVFVSEDEYCKGLFDALLRAQIQWQAICRSSPEHIPSSDFQIFKKAILKTLALHPVKGVPDLELSEESNTYSEHSFILLYWA